MTDEASKPSARHYYVDEAGDANLFKRRAKVIVGKDGFLRDRRWASFGSLVRGVQLVPTIARPLLFPGNVHIAGIKTLFQPCFDGRVLG